MSRFTPAHRNSGKVFSWLLALILMAAIVAVPWAPPAAWAQDGPEGPQEGQIADSPEPGQENLQPFPVNAAAAVLMDAHTGKVLYAKNPAMELAPASLAKIMTVVLALEAIAEGRASLQDQAIISENAWRLSGSSMFLNVGDTVSLEDLLYGIGVVSGNDSALAVAEHLAGSESAFVNLMNQRAQELGLTATVFANSHGLLNGVQKTTAMDMARLARHFVTEHPEGLVYMSTKEYEYGGIRQTNRNGLLFRDDRVTGLKTGFLSAAGYHLVATAQEGDMSLVAAVLGAGGFAQREEDALALLNYGFRNFVTVQPPWGEGGIRTLSVYKGADKSVVVRPARRPLVTVPRQEAGQMAVEDDLPGFLEAPLAAGTVVGRLTISAGGEQVIVPLEVAEDVARGGFFTVLWDSLRLMIRGLVGR
ncbi:MAG TPA: D-alanyl-D-alanine carboxypeptidase family protein [Sphingobacteriaceae bacterium]|nr:D-alanyl-D-alanine carboxypeptidase family protein [Sphingobacteriaceae bacterium]